MTTDYYQKYALVPNFKLQPKYLRPDNNEAEAHSKDEMRIAMLEEWS